MLWKQAITQLMTVRVTLRRVDRDDIFTLNQESLDVIHYNND
jgi:hypothetical protein